MGATRHRAESSRRAQRGATAVEVGLIAALIAVVVIAGIRMIGEQVQSSFENANLGLVDDGLPSCSADERQAWMAANSANNAFRSRHIAGGTWVGPTHRPTRDAYFARRDEVLAFRSRFGC